jgi:thiopurine S-methyltransferase
MESKFWIDVWKEKKIGFHKDSTNELLISFLPKLEIKPSSFIFVPLCGKSQDLIYLADLGHKVIGIELSEIGVKEFFNENNISFEIKEIGKLLKYTSDKIDIYLGNIFDLTSDILGPIDVVYDRASMIALPIDIREKYNKKIDELTDPDTKLLLITLEYDQQKVAGPPFSVPRESINIPGIEVVDEHKPETISPKFSDAGADVIQRVYIKK